MSAFSEWALANPDIFREAIRDGAIGPGYHTTHAAMQDWFARQERYHTLPAEEPEDIFASSLNLLEECPAQTTEEDEDDWMQHTTYYIKSEVNYPPKLGEGIVTFTLAFGTPLDDGKTDTFRIVSTRVRTSVKKGNV
jgi:hypothetical protein